MSVQGMRKGAPEKGEARGKEWASSLVGCTLDTIEIAAFVRVDQNRQKRLKRPLQQIDFSAIHARYLSPSLPLSLSLRACYFRHTQYYVILAASSRIRIGLPAVLRAARAFDVAHINAKSFWNIRVPWPP